MSTQVEPERQPASMLIVVAKQPTAGQTKTRLSPPLTGEQAAELYRCFLADTLAVMRQAAACRPGLRLALAYLPARGSRPAEAADYFARLAPDFELVLQQGAELGERLAHALGHYLAQGAAAALIMNSDGPDLPAAYLVEAVDALVGGPADVTLGPCDDGGYYLIGVRRPAPELLLRPRMSTTHTAADTLAVAAELGLRVHRLPAFYDVDDAEGLQRLAERLRAAAQGAGADEGVAPNTRRFLAGLEIRQR